MPLFTLPSYGTFRITTLQYLLDTIALVLAFPPFLLVNIFLYPCSALVFLASRLPSRTALLSLIQVHQGSGWYG